MVFDSNFDSGNLYRANIATTNEYNLFLSVDTNTHNQTQWFYFSVTNTFKNVTVKFNIVNLTKPCDSVKYGINPYCFSEIEYLTNSVGWEQNVNNVSIYKNDFHGNKSIQYFTLTFSYTFKHTFDRVYFCLYKPYCLKRIISMVKEVSEKCASISTSVTEDDSYGLQNRIDQFIGEQNEDSHVDDGKLIADIKDLTIETKHYLYKQEKLCNSFNLPIILITLTYHK